MSRTPRHTPDPGEAHGALVPGDPVTPSLAPYDHLPRKTEKGDVELNAWGGKVRPIADSILNSEAQFRDPPREIARLMGHMPYFTSIGAMHVHRVGLFRGMGWVLPHSGVRDDVNFVRVVLNENGNTFDLHLGKVEVESNYPPDTVRILRVVSKIAPRDLRKTYERETIDQ